MTKSALLLLNANARKGETQTEEIEAVLKGRGIAPDTVRTQSVDEAIEALRTRGGDHDIVIVGGGDGSLNALLPVLMRLEKPVGIIPLGTANDFARRSRRSDQGDCRRQFARG